MTLAEILADVRGLLDDTVHPYLWSDERLVACINNAIDEACIRVRVVQDSASSLCTISVQSGVSRYTLDRTIFAVRMARLAGIHAPLNLTTAAELDLQFPGFQDATLYHPNEPRAAVFDLGTGTIHLWPVPAADTTLNLLVWRRPTEDERLEVGDDDAEPLVPEHLHRELRHYAAAEAWMDHDSEKFDPQAAARHYSLFDERVGSRPSNAAIESWSVSRRARTHAHFV